MQEDMQTNTKTFVDAFRKRHSIQIDHTLIVKT